MGTDLRVAEQLGVTLGLFALKPKPTCTETICIIDLFVLFRQYFFFYCLQSSDASENFLWQLWWATFPEELPLYCFLMQMETLTTIFIFLWSCCLLLRELPITVAKSYSLNTLIWGVYSESGTGRWGQCEGGFGKQVPVWSLGGTDWLQRRAGGRAAFLSGQQDTADTQTSSPSTCCYHPHCRCCPLLDSSGGSGDVFIVEAFDAIIEVVHLHLLHLNTQMDLYCVG